VRDYVGIIAHAMQQANAGCFLFIGLSIRFLLRIVCLAVALMLLLLLLGSGTAR
jgi:hypothetical protein